MTDVTRNVCMSVGKYVAGYVGRVARILRVLRERFAPDAIDSTFQEMVRFMCSKRTDQYMETYLMRFDMMRQNAAARMLRRSGCPDEFVSILCMQNAALSKNEQALASASLRDTLALPGEPAQMRRLFGPRGHASRQDVPVAADMDTEQKGEISKHEWHIAKRSALRARGKAVRIMGREKSERLLRKGAPRMDPIAKLGSETGAAPETAS